MIDPKALRQIQQAPIAERLHIIELILQSLKHDINTKRTIKQSTYKSFTVRHFSLGGEVHVDRDLLYAERSV